MSRWEPNTRARLERASLELFVERGYEGTTVAEITERAGLTKRTFFRYFADKREVLFGGQEIMSRLLIEGIVGAPESATPFDVITAGLQALTPILDHERLELARQRQAVVAANQDLRERELLKGASLITAMADGFRRRGLPETVVHLAAELCGLGLRMSFQRWLAPGDDEKFADIAGETVAELRTATVALSA
jgi:AcrR family transcriptional regulator